MNTKRMLGVVGLSLTLSCFSASAAVAQHVVVEDAAHDTIDPGLDFTSVNFSNRDRAEIRALVGGATAIQGASGRTQGSDEFWSAMSTAISSASTTPAS